MSRVYVVSDSEGTARLVRANDPRQALAYVARSVFLVRVASQDDLITMLKDAVPPFMIEDVAPVTAPDDGEVANG